MEKTRVRKITNRIGEAIYVVDEVVSKQGHFITWPGHYNTKIAAEAAIDNEQMSY